MIKTQDILKYLEGKSSEIEVAKLKNWLELDVENKIKFDQLSSIHSAANQLTDFAHLDVNEEWKVMKSLLQNNTSEIEVKNTPIHSLKTKKRRNLFGYISAAAMLAFLVSASVYFNEAFINRSMNLNAGISDVSFNLHDGSIINLAEESSISYKEKFEDKRVVELDGQATFDVASDPNKPFLIYTQHTVTEVVGTKFTINGNGDKTQIEVHEGVVKFSKKGNSNKSLTLTQGDKAEYVLGEDVQKVVPVIVKKETPKPKVVAPAIKEVIKAPAPPVKKEVVKKTEPKKEVVNANPYGKTSAFRLKDVIDLLSKRYDKKFKKNRKCKISEDLKAIVNINDYDLEGILEQLELEYDMEFKPNKKCSDCYELKSIKKK